MRKLFRRFDPRLAAELKKQRRPIVIGLVCAALTSLLTAATIPLVQRVIRSIELRDLHTLGMLCLLTVAIFGIKYWFTRGQAYYISKASALMIADLRIQLFRKLQRLPISYFNEKRSGGIQSVLTNDVAVFQNSIMVIRDSIDGPLKAVAAFVAVFLMQWQLALLAFIFMPFLGLFIHYNGRRMREAQAQVQEDYSSLLAMTQEALSGTRIVKAFGAEERMGQSYKAHVDATYSSTMRAVKRIAALRPMVELIGSVALAAVLYLCGILAVRGDLLVSDIIALTYALDVINQGIRNIGSANQTYNQVHAAADRIYREILDVPEGHEDRSGARTLDKPRGRIEFKDVSFVYPDGTHALRGVSFTIEPGTSLALVGPSGAGKSTIADLLLRFYEPTEGQILFDGVDVRDLKVNWLRSQIGVVPQQTFLFAGSIADNIRLGMPEASDEDVAEAAAAAHAAPFIDTMPERYQTPLGERGTRVSGGEMQRIAIARALVRKPTVLLLDEATSSLDAVSEKAVQEALDEIMQERTTLFIAHRLTSAARADKILVLRRGEVVEYGTHRELMQQGGAYASMYQAFSSGVIGEAI
jgi:ATP-binding cassette, subfamily B, bacterial MsbA